jgi:hypothetical protein
MLSSRGSGAILRQSNAFSKGPKFPAAAENCDFTPVFGAKPDHKPLFSAKFWQIPLLG